MENVEHVVKLKEIAKDYRILFVEDSKALQKQIMKFLTKLFKEVYVASDGVEGVQSYDKNRPDLVLTDLTMPNMHGHDMIREIKKINPDVEIVILSAHSDSETLMKSFHIGVTDFIAKPVNAPKMIATFLKVLSNIKRKEYQFLELAGQDPFEKEEKTDEDKDDSEILSFLFENSMKIDIINHYKGVPIINSGKIISIDNDEITLRTTHFQLLAIKEENGAILDSSLISEDIECSLLSMNIDDYEVTLRKKRLFHPEFKDRNEILVQPDSKTKAFIVNDEKHRIEIKLDMVSSKELFINVQKDKFNLEKHDVVNLLIVLSNDENDNPLEYMRVSSSVYKISEKPNNSLDVILLLKESNEVENALQKYIYQREAQLIEEFKAKFQYS